jgi:hypothetical protein
VRIVFIRAEEEEEDGWSMAEDATLGSRRNRSSAAIQSIRKLYTANTQRIHALLHASQLRLLVRRITLIMMRGMTEREREGDPKGWSMVLITTLGSVLGKPVPRGHFVDTPQMVEHGTTPKMTRSLNVSIFGQSRYLTTTKRCRARSFNH